MSTFIISVLEGPERYSREVPQKEAPVRIAAHSFKINDQGTIIFITSSGDAVAAFKHWRDVQPVQEQVSVVNNRRLPEGVVINPAPLATGGAFVQRATADTPFTPLH